MKTAVFTIPACAFNLLLEVYKEKKVKEGETSLITFSEKNMDIVQVVGP